MYAVLKVDPPPGLRLSAAAAVGVVWSGTVCWIGGMAGGGGLLRGLSVGEGDQEVAIGGVLE